MKYSLLSCLLIVLSSTVMAQGNSPFSQFGPGDYYNSNFQSNFSKAGIGASNTSGNTLNPTNPASYSQLTLTTGETGIYSSLNFLNSSNGSDLFTNTNLSSFGLGFPLSDKWGMALGLTPYTKQNYSFSFEDQLQDNSNVEYLYSGDGGLSKLFLGIGGEKNDFSFGLNGQYVFGRLNDISKVKYSSSDYKSIRFQNYNNVSGFSLNAGLQYSIKFNAQNYVKLGGTYELGGNLNTSSYTTANYFTVGNATTSNNKIVEAEFHETTDLVIDTRETPTDGSISLPSNFQTGISIGKFDNWEASLEYRNRNLSGYELNGVKPTFNNSNSIIAGGTIIPNQKALGRSNYWKTMSYNLGMIAGNTGIISQGEELTEFGINFGFGMPLKKFKYQTETFGSSIYLSFGYLNRANSALDVSENYLNINASIVLNDKWFIKRKFQ